IPAHLTEELAHSYCPGHGEHPRPQVEVLHAREPFVEPPDLIEDLPAQHHRGRRRTPGARPEDLRLARLVSAFDPAISHARTRMICKGLAQSFDPPGMGNNVIV